MSAKNIMIYEEYNSTTLLPIDLSYQGNSQLPAVDSETSGFNWAILGLIPVIIASAVGNSLVCIAVCWDRRLQNMTNYFLMSLALADLLVSLLVMPLALVVQLYGHFPLRPSVCVIWATMDVLLCTASIWHMCTMSMDRYCALKYPMRYGRNKTKTKVAIKITFVWLVSIAICGPLCVMGFVDTGHVYQAGRQCVPTLRSFIIYGSIVAFYVPLLIMVVTYALTTRILWTNQKMMKRVVGQHTCRVKNDKKSSPGHNTSSFLSPFIPRFVDKSCDNTTLSINASINESLIPSFSDVGVNVGHRVYNPQDSSQSSTSPAPRLLCSVSSPSNSKQSSPDEPPCCGESTKRCEPRPVISSSQPHLPSMLHRKPVHSVSQQSLSQAGKATSQFSINNLESVKNYLCVSMATSVNSVLSREYWTNSVWNDCQEAEMFDRLSQIEAEMDECLRNDVDDDVEEVTSLLGEFKARRSSSVGGSIVSNTHEICKSFDQSSDQSSDKSSASSNRSFPSSSSSAKSAYVTIQQNGCCVHKVNKSETSVTIEPSNNHCSQNGHVGNNNEKVSKVVNGTMNKLAHEYVSDLCSSGGVHFNSPTDNKDQISADTPSDGAVTWKSQLNRHEPQKKDARFKKVMSKRRASNERKASKVLGIIFGVFVILWTPFFVVNVLSVVCEECLATVSPSAMAFIVWCGYLSSLANPIIYTMFNTAFRDAFYRILTCRQQFRVDVPYPTSSTRARNGENVHMRNMMERRRRSDNSHRTASHNV